MSTQIIRVLSSFLVLSCVLAGVDARAFGDYGSSGNDSGDGLGILETQQRRAAERFDIIGWIRHTQSEVSAQNARWGYHGGHRVRSDVVLLFSQDSGTVTRDAATLGKDTRASGKIQYFLDDLFTTGNKSRSLNIDLGVEGFMSQTTAFQADPASSQLNHSFNETGGGLLIRPFGRSSQDTGIFLKGGYINMTETGLWTNSTNQISLYATYLGTEAKLYLLPFLGLSGDYMATLEQENQALQGRWKMQRFRYGAFLEIYLVNVGAYFMNTEMDMAPDSGAAPVKEIYNGVGFSGSLYF